MSAEHLHASAAGRIIVQPRIRAVTEKYGDREDKHEARIPQFYGTPNEEFNLWSMRDTTAFRSLELAVALTDGDVY